MTRKHVGADGAVRRSGESTTAIVVDALQPALASIPTACKYLGDPSRAKFYADILPDLDVVKFGARTFVTIESLDRVIAVNTRSAAERSVATREKSQKITGADQRGIARQGRPMSDDAQISREHSVISPTRHSTPATTLLRETFTTSRLGEFCTREALTKQTGHPVADWPLVIGKETIDNAIDIAEEYNLAPVIEVEVSTDRCEIVITDNGPGIPAETVHRITDYSTRTSSRQAYVSPTRGARGCTPSSCRLG